MSINRRDFAKFCITNKGYSEDVTIGIVIRIEAALAIMEIEDRAGKSLDFRYNDALEKIQRIEAQNAI